MLHIVMYLLTIDACIMDAV